MQKHTQIFVASLLVGILLPVTTKALYNSEHIQLHNGRTQIQAGNVTKLSRRASFSKALRIYEVLVQKGLTDITKPDINDPATVEFYLKAYPNGVSIDGAPEATEPVSTKEYELTETDELQDVDISVAEREALRRSAKIGKCWDGLFQFSKGFDALCQKMIRQSRRRPARTTGIQSDLIQMRQ